MKLRQRGKTDLSYVTDNDTRLKSQDERHLRRLSKTKSTLSIPLGQDNDGYGTESPRITLPELLSPMEKLEEAADSAACEADTS